MAASRELRAALAATIQACGAAWGEETLPFVLRDLELYPEPQVLDALDRCRKELRYKLTLADIIERIADGRPAPDEAWAQVSPALDERRTVVATNEALEALREVAHLAKDDNAARMGFRAAYQRIVLREKAQGRLPRWIASLGHDPEGREPALAEAANKGRLDRSRIAGLLGAATAPALALAGRSEDARLEDGQRRAAAILDDLNSLLRADRQRQREREPRYDWRAEEERLQNGAA